jgi:hypothetical protein
MDQTNDQKRGLEMAEMAFRLTMLVEVSSKESRRVTGAKIRDYITRESDEGTVRLLKAIIRYVERR